MHRGRLLRIILFVLVLGMGLFLLLRGISLKKQLNTGEISEIGVRDFLPFGSSGNGGVLQNILDGIGIGDGNNEISPTIKHVEKIANSVAGMKMIVVPDEVAGPTGKDKEGNDIYEYIPALRYVTSENGYVYDYVPKYKKSYLRSDTPIPKVSFAHFSMDGNSIIFQYLDGNLSTEKSVLGTLGSQNVYLLPDNLLSFAFAPDGKFAYVRKSDNGSIFMLRDTKGVESALYSSPLTEWNISFLGSQKLLITTKASEQFDGFAYILDIPTKKLSRLWNSVPGLTAIASVNGNFILRAETIASGPILSLYNVKTGSLQEIGKMGLTEKCTFQNDETAFICALPQSFESKLYPDSWYTGETTTRDRLARYTTANLNEKQYPDIENEIGSELNTWKLSLGDAGNLIGIINRNDMSLWLYQE